MVFCWRIDQDCRNVAGNDVADDCTRVGIIDPSNRSNKINLSLPSRGKHSIFRASSPHGHAWAATQHSMLIRTVACMIKQMYDRDQAQAQAQAPGSGKTEAETVVRGRSRTND
jgi:hypothetical protein